MPALGDGLSYPGTDVSATWKRMPASKVARITLAVVRPRVTGVHQVHRRKRPQPELAGDVDVVVELGEREGVALPVELRVVAGVADPVEAAGELLRSDRQRVAGARPGAVERDVVAHPAGDGLGALGGGPVVRGLEIGRGDAVGAARVDVAGEEVVVDLDADVGVPLAQEQALRRPGDHAVEQLQRVEQAGRLGEVQRQRLAAVAVDAIRGQDPPAGIDQQRNRRCVRGRSRGRRRRR